MEVLTVDELLWFWLHRGRKVYDFFDGPGVEVLGGFLLFGSLGVDFEVIPDEFGFVGDDGVVLSHGRGLFSFVFFLSLISRFLLVEGVL